MQVPVIISGIWEKYKTAPIMATMNAPVIVRFSIGRLLSKNHSKISLTTFHIPFKNILLSNPKGLLSSPVTTQMSSTHRQYLWYFQ